jgi:hypothetical protein
MYNKGILGHPTRQNPYLLGDKMLDTVKLYTDDFVIRDDTEISIRPSDINYKTGETNNHKLFKGSNGQWVTGSKAFLNAENFNLTIKPNNLTDKIHLWISLSVPKFITGDNFYPLDDSEAEGLPSGLDTELKKRGIGLSVGDLAVSRIDTFQNVYASEAFGDYVPVFQLLKAKRQNKREYGSTFLWENTQREICVYDKLTEVINRGQSVDGLPSNTIRFEYRLLKSKSVKGALKINTVQNLFYNLGSIREVYRDAMRYHLFDLEVSEVKRLVSSELRTVVKHYLENGGRYWITNLLKDYGAYSIARLSSIDVFGEIVEDVSGSRKMAYRAKKYVRDCQNQVAMLEVLECGKTIDQLYQELKNKVLE